MDTAQVEEVFPLTRSSISVESFRNFRRLTFRICVVRSVIDTIKILTRKLLGGETFASKRVRILRKVAMRQSVHHSDVHELQAYFQKVRVIIAKASRGEHVPVFV